MNSQKPYKPEETNNINMLPGDLNGSPDESFSSKDTFVFIDVGFLEKLSKHFGNENYLKFDRKKFSENLSKKEGLNCKQIFYYTAPPFQPSNPSKTEERKKKGYDKFIKKLRKIEIIVREGRCQRLQIDGKFIYNQKAVDILLAMDLMRIPIEFPKTKKIILISSDSDFVPIIRYLKEIGIKTTLFTYYEKGRNSNFSRSNHLIKSVHKYVLLSKKDFEEAKL